MFFGVEVEMPCCLLLGSSAHAEFQPNQVACRLTWKRCLQIFWSLSLSPSQGEISCAWNISDYYLSNMLWVLQYWSDVLLPHVSPQGTTLTLGQQSRICQIPCQTWVTCSGYDFLCFPQLAFLYENSFQPFGLGSLAIGLFLYALMTSWLSVCSLSSI